MEFIKMMLDQVQDDFNIELINTVCMIDECNCIDNMLCEALMKENLSLIDIEIEEMIINDIEYWNKVYREFDEDYYLLDHYEMYDDYI